ncbi:MAG: SDR family oxidoreductase [Acidimicrobiia bacterium]|nr:SDR family oxidoreductase [Acidimicrobiia bacterium]
MTDASPLDAARVLVAGASSGIGAALTTELVGRGARVVACARRSERLAEVIGTAGGGLAVGADVTDADDCDRVLETVDAELGMLDALVYAAGVGTMAALADNDPEAWHRDYAVNVIGANILTARALPHLADSGIAAYISSRSTEDSHWGLSSYAASKAALDQSIRSWRVEHRDKRFLRIQMGNTVGTEFGEHLDPAVTEHAMSQWPGQGIDLGFMEVSDVAGALADVLSTALAHPALDIREYQLDGRPL